MAFALPTYQITIRGHMDDRWDRWFDGFTISPTYTAEGEAVTELTGTVVDQAALYGLLTCLRKPGVSLVSVQPIEDESAWLSMSGPNTIVVSAAGYAISSASEAVHAT